MTTGAHVLSMSISVVTREDEIVVTRVFDTDIVVARDDDGTRVVE